MATRQFLSVVVLLLLLLVGCRHDTPVQTTPPPTTHTGEITYTVYAQDLRAPRANETYLLWIRPTGTTDLIKLAELVVDKYKLHGPDSLVLTGKTNLKDSLLPYDEALISLEPDTSVTKPGSVLMLGAANGAGIFDMDPATEGAVADLRFTTASATFGTRSADTTRSHHEFYLADLSGSTPISTLANLPNIGFGWHYAIWVTDSFYSPLHLFYYGAFLHPNGHDSDSTNDSFAFPGGFEPPSLDNTHAKIEITVEPDFHLANVKALGPSPFPILEGAIPINVYSRLVVSLTNVVSRGLPKARLILKVN
jgi:hypothetical protein